MPPVEPTTPPTVTPESTPVETPPAPSLKPVASPKSSKTAGIAVAVVLALAIIGLGVMTQSQSSKAATKVTALEKRLKTLEATDNYAGAQVDSSRYQAVFLNTGQVYFGKITKITKTTLTLEDIFYLNQGSFDKSQAVTATGNVSLVKLGKELHKPDDKMIIERQNETFWENLKSDGEVAKAITQYKKSNP